MNLALRPLKFVRLEAPEAMGEAARRVIDVLSSLATDSERMRVLAAASAIYGREKDAKWFLDAAIDPQARSPRCGRCGQVR